MLMLIYIRVVCRRYTRRDGRCGRNTGRGKSHALLNNVTVCSVFLTYVIGEALSYPIRQFIIVLTIVFGSQGYRMCVSDDMRSTDEFYGTSEVYCDQHMCLWGIRACVGGWVM